MNVYTFNASDDQDESLTVYVLGWEGYGVLWEVEVGTGNYTFTVDLRTADPTTFFEANVSSLVFYTNDSLGVYGELNPRVVVYACLNGGSTTTLGNIITQGTTEFLNCECLEGSLTLY